MKKICVVVASRANYARIKSFLKAVDEHTDLELQLVCAASTLLERSGNAKHIIEEDGFKVDEQVYTIVEGSTPLTMAKSTGLGIIELTSIFDRLKPDYVLTIADRFETLSTAVAASYMNIPLVHTQGGEITGSIDESVRHAITQLAHIHFPATDLSAERLIKMGQDPKFVFNVGCPSMDIIPKDLRLPQDFFNKIGGIGKLDISLPYVVVMQHPVTTEWEQARFQMSVTLEAVHRLNYQTLVLWPNVDAGSDGTSKAIRVFREQHPEIHDYWQFVKNMSPEDYARLINGCRCLIGNTSSGIREGSYLGVPVVNVGDRQNNRERGNNVIDAEYSVNDILKSAQYQAEHGKYPQERIFGNGTAGKQMADILATIPKPNCQKVLQY